MLRISSKNWYTTCIVLNDFKILWDSLLRRYNLQTLVYLLLSVRMKSRRTPAMAVKPQRDAGWVQGTVPGAVTHPTKSWGEHI